MAIDSMTGAEVPNDVVEFAVAADGIPSLQLGVAGELAVTGRVEEAGALLRPFVDAGLATLPRDLTRTACFGGASDVILATNDVEGARQLVALLTPYRDQVAAVAVLTSHGPVAALLARALLVVGDVDAAEAEYRRAIELARDLGYDMSLACSEVELAGLLLRGRRPAMRSRRAAWSTTRSLSLGDAASEPSSGAPERSWRRRPGSAGEGEGHLRDEGGAGLDDPRRGVELVRRAGLGLDAERVVGLGEDHPVVAARRDREHDAVGPPQHGRARRAR